MPQNLVAGNPEDFRRQLHQMWFSLYSRSHVRDGTCGFEHGVAQAAFVSSPCMLYSTPKQVKRSILLFALQVRVSMCMSVRSFRWRDGGGQGGGLPQLVRGSPQHGVLQVREDSQQHCFLKAHPLLCAGSSSTCVSALGRSITWGTCCPEAGTQPCQTHPQLPDLLLISYAASDKQCRESPIRD